MFKKTILILVVIVLIVGGFLYWRISQSIPNIPRALVEQIVDLNLYKKLRIGEKIENWKYEQRVLNEKRKYFSLQLSVEPDQNNPRRFVIIGPNELVTKLKNKISGPWVDCGGAGVNWGEVGNYSRVKVGDSCEPLLTHTYQSSGTYTVKALFGGVAPTDGIEVYWQDSVEVVVK